MVDLNFYRKTKQFQCILADPPWGFKSYTKLTDENRAARRDVEKHYKVMSIPEIAELPVGEIASKNCHLFLCTTGPFLAHAIEIMRGWGFKYSTVAFVWVKLKRSHNPAQLRFLPSAEDDLHVGLGLTTRKNCEYVLLGRKGSPHRNARDIREVIMSPVREHSRKPDEVYSRIERYCDGPRLELFARQSRDRWETWGNERRKFDATPQASASPATPSLP